MLLSCMTIGLILTISEIAAVEICLAGSADECIHSGVGSEGMVWVGCQVFTNISFAADSKQTVHILQC